MLFFVLLIISHHITVKDVYHWLFSWSLFYLDYNRVFTIIKIVIFKCRLYSPETAEPEHKLNYDKYHSNSVGLEQPCQTVSQPVRVNINTTDET